MARRILAVLLLAMAVGQVLSFGRFVDIMATYQLGGGPLPALLAVALIAGEAVAGVSLLLGPAATRHRGAAIGLGVAGAWSVIGLQAFLRGLAVDNCGCFGAYLAQPLRWWVLLQDIEFLALAVWARRSTDPERHRPLPGPARPPAQAMQRSGRPPL